MKTFKELIEKTSEVDEAKGALTYKQEHSKWGVVPKSKKEFVKFFPKDKEDEARAHAEKTGGKLQKIDQMGRSIREEVEIEEANKPGWMLKQDKELAKKVKEKIDLAKKRQAAYGDKSAGKSVSEELDEAHKIGDPVEIVSGSSKGIKGHIGEIRHGLFKGAPKTYTVYHGEHGAVQVKKEHIRSTKNKVEEAYMSSDRSKRMFKSNELRHELGHEDKPMRSSAPAEPHSVHINGKKWKTFPDKNHATNVANKIKGATVVKESEELDEVNVMNRTSPVRRGNYVHSDKSATPGKDGGTHNVVDAAGKVVASYKNKLDAIDHAMKKDEYRVKSIYEEVEIDEASDFHAEAMEHKKKADAAMDKNDLEAYHHHMSAHHESMGQWQESKGRSSIADKEYEKAEKHHELSLKKSNQKNEGTNMLSFKYFQEVLEEAKKKMKNSSCELENAHSMDDMEDELDDEEKEKLEEAINEVLSKDASAGEWISDFVHSDNPKFAGKSKEKRKQMALAAYYAAQRNEEVEELDEATITHIVAKKDLPAHKEWMDSEGFDTKTKPLPKGHPKHATHVGIVSSSSKESSYHEDGHAISESVAPVAPAPGMKDGKYAIMVHSKSKQRVTIERKNKGNYPESEGWKEVGLGVKLKEEVEIDEADELSSRHKFVFNKTPAGKAREVARNREELKMQMKKTKEMGGISGPKGKLPEEVEEAVSPFDWKAYAKERGSAADKKTKTFHDVKKTSTGTVYTKQVNPDGTSKGSGDDAAKAAEKEQAPKRGRGRPAGVGAKTGSYKPRDPAKKAASAAKAAASKAANRAMRKERFDEEFMSSLIEGFEDEDFDDFLQCEEFSELDEATQDALHDFINEKCMSKMKESLTGKQHKLDKNKNGKLDSEDFKLLRKEETEQIQESVTSYAAFLNKK